MKPRRLWHSKCFSRFVVALALAYVPFPLDASGWAQQAPSDVTTRPTLPGTAESHDGRDPHDPFAEQTASKMTHLREDERRKRLIADTARLVALTSELKSEVDNTTRDELSLDVIRKATEIEKLARDVRERMKN